MRRSLCKHAAGRGLRFLSAALLVISAATLVPSPAAATGEAPGVHTLQRGATPYFNYQLNPGDSAHDGLVVSNESSTTATYMVYAVDGYTSPTTGIVYQDRSAPVGDVGRWISVSQSQLTLAPKQQVAVNFTVAVPKQVEPGDWVGAIAVENATTAAQSSGRNNLALNVRQRAALAVVVHIPGPTQVGFVTGDVHLRVENDRRQVIDIPMHSTSNVFIKPQLGIAVTTCNTAKQILSTSQQLDTFTRLASITYPDYLDNVVLSAGCYRVRTAISYNNALLDDHTTQLNVSSQQATLHPNGTGNARSANQSVGKLPLPLIAGGAVLLVVVVVVLLLLLRRGRRHQHERARARAKLNRLIEPLEQEEDTEVVSPWRSMRR